MSGPIAHLARSVRFVLLLWLTSANANAAAGVSFFALGDTPYNDAESELLVTLLEQVSTRQPAFIVHVGDIKGGSQPCTDARNRRIADLFRMQPAPLIYTPGDNEWTDCHRERAGALDPLQRLDALRRTFYSDPGVLHHGALGIAVPNADFPENAFFSVGDLFFVVAHVVGSNNAWPPNTPSAEAAFEARAAANAELLHAAAIAAREAQARALVVMFHANPLFERASPKPGFARFLDDLAALAGRFEGPVLLIHGDTHRYQFDRPLRAPTTGAALEHVQRLEVPGAPTVAGVWVTVDPDAEEVFSVRTIYPNASDDWLDE